MIMNICQRIKELREARKLSIRNLAEKVELSASTVARIERGERKISTPQAITIANFFGVSADYLLGAEPEEMLNDFVGSIHKTFYFTDVDAHGDATRGIHLSVPRLLAIKLETISILSGLKSLEALERIYNVVKHEEAKEDFS